MKNGTVKIGGTNALYFEYIDIKDLPESETEAITDKVKSDPWGIPGHEQIIVDLMDAVKENRDPLVSGEDGKNALQLVLAFYQSAESNRPINMERGVLV
jgi:predicted dehydrogenase